MVDNDELILEDWKMTKDRIKHFDTLLSSLRLQSIPLGTGVLTVGFYLISDNPSNSQYSYIFLFASILMVPFLIIDILHLIMLSQSVNHAIDIENKEPFKGHLTITTKLTSKRNTCLHYIGSLLIYAIIMGAGFNLVFV